MEIAGRGVSDDEVGFLCEERFVACTCCKGQDEFLKGLGYEARGGEKDGLGFGEV